MKKLTVEGILASSERSRLPLIGVSAALAVATAVLDWLVAPNFSLGLLYIFPVVLASLVLERWELCLLTGIFSALREHFSPTPWEPQYSFRLGVVWSAFLGAALFVKELKQNWIQTNEHLAAMKAETDFRLRREELLRTMVETSPLAVLVLDARGCVELANSSAARLFGFDSGGEMQGADIRDLVPTLASPLEERYGDRPLKAALECSGRTRYGEPFLASVWFATFAGGEGRQLAAVIWDESESLRSREVAGWEALVATTRTVLGSALHELRSLSEEAGEVQRRLEENPALAGSPELRALSTLISGIEEIAAEGLHTEAEAPRETANVADVLEELRILMEPAMAEAGVRFHADLPERQLVRIGHHALLQVLLNLCRNARRETENETEGDVRVKVQTADGLTCILFSNSGPPVAEPYRLFRPFASGRNSAGLGLYVSHALVRSSGGDLRYETRDGRPCFMIELLAVSEK